MLPLAEINKMFTSDVMAAFRADNEYVEEHFKEWLEAYRGQWVVVKDRQLLLVTPNESDVMDAIKRHGSMAIVRLMQPRGFDDVTPVRSR